MSDRASSKSRRGFAILACVALLAIAGCSRHLSPEEQSSIKVALAELAQPDQRYAFAPESGAMGDPINVAFVGSAAQLGAAAKAAGWVVSDPITQDTTTRLIRAVLAQEPYANAPISDLYFLGQKQQIAFEQPSGSNPSTRHHARFWQTGRSDSAGRQIWVGAASYDDGVAANKITKKMTHRISPDLDTERDKIAADFSKAGGLDGFSIDGYLNAPHGSNSGGFPFNTDQRLRVLAAVR